MTYNNTFKNIAPSILLGGAVGCGILFATETLFSKLTCNKNVYHRNINSQPTTEDVPNVTCNPEDYSKEDYNDEGLSHDGFGVTGFERDYFNIKGFDRCNRNRRFYMNYLARLYALKEESLHLLSEGSYRYALLNSRTIVDDTLSLLLGHVLGNPYQSAKITTKLRLCEKYRLIGDDKKFIKGLYRVCRICSPRMHTIENENEITHKQVFFTIMQSMRLLQMTEKKLLFS